jgi:hypothetical protein
MDWQNILPSQPHHSVTNTKLDDHEPQLPPLHVQPSRVNNHGLPFPNYNSEGASGLNSQVLSPFLRYEHATMGDIDTHQNGIGNHENSLEPRRSMSFVVPPLSASLTLPRDTSSLSSVCADLEKQSHGQVMDHENRLESQSRVQSSRRSRASQHGEMEWQQNKKRIEQLYMKEDLSLSEVVRLMREHHDFHAT